MSDIKQKCSEFLKSYRMHHDDIDMQQSCEVFLNEMEKGLAGQESSLAMIPTYIETDKRVPRNERVLVMDAGGTNFRAATVYFNECGKAVIENVRKGKMPGVDSQVGKEEFFETLAEYVKDIVNVSEKIGFCFSYPCDIQPSRDGRLTHFSKEIKAPAVVGQMVGENLSAAVSRKAGVERKRVVVLNDTVTTLLAGIAGFEAKNYDSYVGFILGTGTNTCYIEKNSNITKRAELDPAKSQIINVESGGFCRAPRGQIDEQFDSSTNNPGVYTFEKMISGAYLGPLCLEVIRTAVNEQLFSSVAAEKLRGIKQLDTKQISDYLAGPDAQCNLLGEVLAETSNYDKTMAELLVKAIVERAAKLTAINLSAAVLKSGKGDSPDRPVCIVAEGTTFYSLKGLKEGVEKCLRGFLATRKERYYEIVNVENATLIGAAIAGLTN